MTQVHAQRIFPLGNSLPSPVITIRLDWNTPIEYATAFIYRLDDRNQVEILDQNFIHIGTRGLTLDISIDYLNNGCEFEIRGYSFDKKLISSVGGMVDSLENNETIHLIDL